LPSFLYVKYGIMSKGKWLPELSSNSHWPAAVLCLSMVLRRSESKIENKIPVAYPLNKLIWASDLQSSGVVVSLFLCHRGGGKTGVSMASDLARSGALGVEAATKEDP
jgi:hypothetical protein